MYGSRDDDVTFVISSPTSHLRTCLRSKGQQYDELCRGHDIQLGIALREVFQPIWIWIKDYKSNNGLEFYDLYSEITFRELDDVDSDWIRIADVSIRKKYATIFKLTWSGNSDFRLENIS